MPARKSATPNRAFKVADQIQRDLTELIARELKDRRVGMVTIQSVEVTPDYAHAKVFFSLLQGDPVQTQEGLNQAAGFQTAAYPHRPHTAFPVRPHDRTRGGHECVDRAGRGLAFQERGLNDSGRVRII